MMQSNHVIELSRTIEPNPDCPVRFQVIHPEDSSSMTSLTYNEAIWHIVGLAQSGTETGTTILLPFHDLSDWTDDARFPISRLIGDMVVISGLDPEAVSEIGVSELQACEDEIVEGNIVFFHQAPRITASRDRFSADRRLGRPAVEWLIDRKVACVGSDGYLLSAQDVESKALRQLLSQAGIPIVCHLTRLEQVRTGAYLTFVIPMAVNKLDICPARVIAIRKEQMPGF